MGNSVQAVWDGFGFPSFAAFLFHQEKHCLRGTIEYVNYELGRLYQMANRSSGKQGKAASKSIGGDWQGFANVPLDEADRGVLRSGSYDFVAGLEDIRSLLASGHKVSLSLNPDSGSVTASATGVRNDCPNKGYTLTAFANDVTDALTVLAYKHQVKAKGTWAKFAAPKNDDDFG